MEREKLGSRLGFILLSAGCAIGIGNVWRFPWLAGQHGGGWFVLAYLACLAVLGLPVMTMEFAMGRASRRSPVGMYQTLGRPGWRWHGALSLLGCVALMMYYTTVAGWMLTYFGFSAAGSFAGLDAAGIGAKFGETLAQPGLQAGMAAAVTAAGFGVCAAGLRRGLERVTKWMMLALLGLMVALAVHSVSLPCGAEGGGSAMDGIRYLLVPDAANVASHGGWTALLKEAMNQAFFTLSLGVGSMAIFGSYIGRERALAGEAARVTALDTLVALSAGLIVLPACFAFGVEPGAGPGLLFVTLPNVFGSMAWGRLWGSLFFVFMSFAAMSTVLAVFENILACAMELTGWGRKKTAWTCAAAMFALSLPCAWGWSWLSWLHPMGGGEHGAGRGGLFGVELAVAVRGAGLHAVLLPPVWVGLGGVPRGGQPGAWAEGAGVGAGLLRVGVAGAGVGDFRVGAVNGGKTHTEARRDSGTEGGRGGRNGDGKRLQAIAIECSRVRAREKDGLRGG